MFGQATLNWLQVNPSGQFVVTTGPSVNVPNGRGVGLWLRSDAAPSAKAQVIRTSEVVCLADLFMFSSGLANFDLNLPSALAISAATFRLMSVRLFAAK